MDNHMKIRDSKGKFAKGISGNTKGRPKEQKTKLKEVDEILTKKGITFSGDFKEYGLAYLTTLSEVGLHTLLWEELLKFGPYLQGKKANVDHKESDGKVEISFSNEDILDG